MIRAYADIDNDLLVVVFDWEVHETESDADVTQFVMPEMAGEPGGPSPSAYASVDFNQIALDYPWPVFMPATVTLVYTKASPGNVVRERNLAPVESFTVDVLVASPPSPVADRFGGVRGRDRSFRAGPV